MNQKPLQGVPPPQWHRLNKGPQKCADQKIKKVPQATVYSKKTGAQKGDVQKKKKVFTSNLVDETPICHVLGPNIWCFLSRNLM